ncbi:hypothetical protein KC686_04065, partial [Candidatus Woesebacteria bacterium]|nr:hypothetical protein [Candidatus Woesebacteria bacterium]
LHYTLQQQCEELIDTQQPIPDEMRAQLDRLLMGLHEARQTFNSLFALYIDVVKTAVNSQNTQL